MQPTSTASNPLFDRDFLRATMMGPNCVRFAEELTANIPLSPHMRVLDLGCGMGLSSIYLARTFGVRVFAADLWINPQLILALTMLRCVCRGPVDKPFGQLCAVPGLRA